MSCTNITQGDLLTLWLEVPYNHYILLQVFDKTLYEYIIILDKLINNQDRHFFNFGYLYNSHTCELIRPAQIFDNVFSLLTDVVNREHLTA